jgi:hypothetical protein
MQIKQRMVFDCKGAYPVRLMQVGEEYVRVVYYLIFFHASFFPAKIAKKEEIRG